MSSPLSKEATAMRPAPASIALSLIASLALSAGLAQAAVTDSSAPGGFAWQHHSAKVNYMGFTSAYTCDGIEGKVRDIMRYLGARKDLQVQAQGCPRGPDSLEHLIWINVQFDTLAPAAPGTAAADLVPAQWTAFKLDGQRPFFMGAGDCELIDALKPLLTANFSLRALDYSTSCTPHEVTFADFRVQGEVLMSGSEHAG
jgi:hypothetical protein